MQRTIILASASPGRLHLLKTINIIPDLIMPMDIDESEHAGELPKNLALRLAIAKAKAAADNVESGVIIAADTVTAIGRKILPKALDNEAVKYCLKKMSGRRHRVFTGLSIILKDKNCEQKQISRVVESIIKYKRLTDAEIKLYLDSKEGIGKSGGTSVNGLSQVFIEWMSGSNSNIIGLPLYELYSLLTGLGINIENIIKAKAQVA